MATDPQLERVEAAMPSTFYAGLPIERRVARMTEVWRRAIEANSQLEIDNERLVVALQNVEGALREAYR